MRDFSILEFHYHDVRQIDFLSSWRDPWQEVIPLCVVSEAHNEFVDDLVFSDGAGDGRHLRIFGDLVYEVLAVKATDFPAAGAPRQSSDAVYIRLGHHGFHRGVNIKIGKLSRDVSVEERAEIGIRVRGKHGPFSSWCFLNFHRVFSSDWFYGSVYVRFVGSDNSSVKRKLIELKNLRRPNLVKSNYPRVC